MIIPLAFTISLVSSSWVDVWSPKTRWHDFQADVVSPKTGTYDIRADIWSSRWFINSHGFYPSLMVLVFILFITLLIETHFNTNYKGAINTNNSLILDTPCHHNSHRSHCSLVGPVMSPYGKECPAGMLSNIASQGM